MRLAVPLVALLLLSWSDTGPVIRHVPRMVDSTFDRRTSLCPGARTTGGDMQANEARLGVSDLLGGITAVDVHQFGTDFSGFTAVRSYLSDLLAERPRASYWYSPWAEATPLRASGVLATVHFPAGTRGRLEAAGVHLCLEDSTGIGRWWRLTPLDVWGRQE
jgi:hypothetical protein